MSSSVIEETISILTQLQVFEYNDDIIETVMHSSSIEDAGEEIINLIEQASSQPKTLKRLINYMVDIRDSDYQGKFWDELSEQEKSPGIFQVLICGLVSAKGKTKRSGALLYSVLLGTQPISLLWNPILFNQILSIMVKTSQEIENVKKFDKNNKKDFKLALFILQNLSKALNKQFDRLAGQEIIFALIELAYKLFIMVAKVSKDKIQHIKELSNAGISFIESASTNLMDLIIPFMVSGLLLEYLPSSKRITQMVVEIRKKIIHFVGKSLQDQQAKLLNVINHLLIRCPDRAPMRDNVSFVISELSPFLSSFVKLLDTLTKMSNSTKMSQRVLSMDVLSRIIFKNELEIPQDTMLGIVEQIKSRFNDIAPTVRAASLYSFNVLLTNCSDEFYEILDCDSFLFQKLDKRLTDEKIIVRKAAIKVIRTYLQKIDLEPEEAIFQRIADRMRDRSIIIRSEAATILTECMEKFFNTKIIEIWFDSIMPLTMDSEAKVQDAALRMFSNSFLEKIETEDGMTMASCITESHLDLLDRVLPVYRQKAINMGTFCKRLRKLLTTDAKPIFWKLASIMIGVTFEHFKGFKFQELWNERKQLPVQFLEIISKTCVEKQFSQDTITQIYEDSLELLNQVSDGIDDNLLPDAKFACIHATCLIVKHYSPDPEVVFQNILEKLLNTINATVGNEKMVSKEAEDLVTRLFLVGEVVLLYRVLGNYDFTGVQLLIADRLPNEVEVPYSVRSIATITLGKMCISRRDFSSSFVSAFATQLYSSRSIAVKCNCLITLCDLCVKYSATVDPYVLEMTTCFADESTVVKRQALLIMTRLIAEDFVKLRPLLFFRFCHTIIDPQKEVADFARSCLFDVLCAKDEQLIINNFIDTIFYFNDLLDSIGIEEDRESHEKFRLRDKDEKRQVYKLLLMKLESGSLFELLDTICKKILKSIFLEEQMSVIKGEELLSDTLYVMLIIEEDMDVISVTEANNEANDAYDQVHEQTRVYINILHNNLISSVLSILNQMHRFLKDHNSSLQTELRHFFRALLQKHPQLFEELARAEPILAYELKNEIPMAPTPVTVSLPVSPIRRTPFKSPLLSRLAKTPVVPLTTLDLSSNQSPVTFLSQSQLLSQVVDDEDSPTQKRQPILEFNLDDDV